MDSKNNTQSIIQQKIDEQNSLIYSFKEKKKEYGTYLCKLIQLFVDDYKYDYFKQTKKSVEYIHQDNLDPVMTFKAISKNGPINVQVLFVEKEKEVKMQGDTLYIIVFNDLMNINKKQKICQQLKQDKKSKNILFFCQKQDLEIDIFNDQSFFFYTKIYKINKQQFQQYSNLGDNGFCGIYEHDFLAQIVQLKSDELVVLEYPFDDGIKQQIRQLQ